jgi:acetolactate synthase-1/2/3 large subunit
LVRDITISHSTWGNRLFPVYAPGQSIHAASGGIGMGFQMALGVKLGQPERQVAVIVGDGGFQVNLGELATMVQENIPVVILLFNDGGYGVLRNIQDRGYEGRHIGVELTGLNFGRLAAAYGINHHLVSSSAQFRPAVEAALASGQPAMIEIDMAAVGPFAVPFAGPAASA